MPNEQLPMEPTPEIINYDQEAQAAILSFEAACLEITGQSISENPQFLKLYSELTERLENLTNEHSGPDASVWYNYYLTNTFGILSENFPEFTESFNSAYDELSYLAGNLEDEDLRKTWMEKISSMKGE